MYPPDEVDSIRVGLNEAGDEAGGFLPFVFGADAQADRGQQMRYAMSRYTASLSRTHRDDQLVV